jgi:AcrR family transcriptional regulator
VTTADRSRRPGRPPRLSRALVVNAARAIVANEGIDALTMRRVAAELRSSPMAIYRHVRDRDELLIALLDELAGELPRPAFSSQPRERLRQACQSMRDGLAQHPWVVDVLAAGDLIAPNILWLMEEIVAAFVACGLSPAEAAAGYRTVWQYTVGDLIVARGVAHIAQLGRMPYVLHVLTHVDAEQFPTLAQLAPYWSRARASDTFGHGLDALLSGLLARGKR